MDTAVLFLTISVISLQLVAGFTLQSNDNPCYVDSSLEPVFGRPLQETVESIISRTETLITETEEAKKQWMALEVVAQRWIERAQLMNISGLVGNSLSNISNKLEVNDMLLSNNGILSTMSQCLGIVVTSSSKDHRPELQHLYERLDRDTDSLLCDIHTALRSLGIVPDEKSARAVEASQAFQENREWFRNYLFLKEYYLLLTEMNRVYTNFAQNINA